MTTTRQTTTLSTLDELRPLVGTCLGSSSWVTVDQARIDAFADATGDHQWIHVDPERARGGPYGATIAHGFWTLSSAPFILRGGSGGDGVQVRLPSRMGLNYGLNRVRFINPVRVGKRIRVRSKLISLEEVLPNVIQQVSEITVEIEAEVKPAMVAESVSRAYLDTQS